jgi:phosphoesterase RecJ-like protein
MKTKTINEIINCIYNNSSFLITSHISPDGDALGSVIALGLILKKLNKKVMYHIDPAIGDKYSFLTEIEDINSNITDNKFDVGICLDCSDINHLFDSNILNQCKEILNIDHHISNKLYGNINLVDSKASATGEIIYELLTFFKIIIDRNIAIALYTAIVTDTGNFKYSNTTSKTHFIVSELLKQPFEAWKINKIVFDEHKISKIFLIGKVINNLQFFLDNRLAITVLTQKDLEEVGAQPDEVEGLINIGRDIIGVEVSILIKEKNLDEYKIGFRSNEYVDVGEIALDLGGGGHSRASGCTISGNKDEIINKLKSIISNKI